MPIPTSELEHFEDWREFAGYTPIKGCVVHSKLLNLLYSGNLSKVQVFKNQPQFQDS